MNPVTLKKPHFNGNDVLIMADGAISDGYWAIRSGAVKNAAAFTTPEVAAAALGLNGRTVSQVFDDIAPSGDLHQWTATRWVCAYARVEARVFQSTETGEFAGIARRILAIAGLDEPFVCVFGKDPKAPFMDAATITDAVFIAMPFKIEPFPGQEAK